MYVCMYVCIYVCVCMERDAYIYIQIIKGPINPKLLIR